MFAVYKTLVRQAARTQIPFKRRLLHLDSVNQIESAIDVSSTQYQVRTFNCSQEQKMCRDVQNTLIMI